MSFTVRWKRTIRSLRRRAGFGEGYSPTRFRAAKFELQAKFGPAVESCSIKSALPPASFPFTTNTAERFKIFGISLFSLLTWSHRNQKAANLFDRLAASNRLIACQYILNCRFIQQPLSYKQISPDRPCLRSHLQNSYSAATRLWSRGIWS